MVVINVSTINENEPTLIVINQHEIVEENSVVPLDMAPYIGKGEI